MFSIAQLQYLATCKRYDPAAYLALCRALVAKGEREAAKTYFDRWQRVDPGNRMIGHQRHLLLAEEHLAKLPPGYVVDEFDGFADSFDRTLAGLHYRVPSRFGELLHRWLGEGRLDRALDLGCGTGLCGVQARRYANCLWGLDVSAGMLEKARRRGIYDRLVEGDFQAFLDACEERFELIVAGDSLIYVGDLHAVLDGASRILAPGGFMLMSFEKAEGGVPFMLPATLRFKHSYAYVETVLRQCGMRVEHRESCVIRQEGGKPVPGLIVMARRADLAVR